MDKADEIRSLQSSSACRTSASRLPLIDPTAAEPVRVLQDSDNESASQRGLLTLQPDDQCIALLGSRIPAVPSNTFPPDHPDHEAQCIDVIRKADKHITALHLRRIIHNNSQSTATATNTASRSPLPAADKPPPLAARAAAATSTSRSNSYVIVVLLLVVQMCWALRIVDVEINLVD